MPWHTLTLLPKQVSDLKLFVAVPRENLGAHDPFLLSLPLHVGPLLCSTECFVPFLPGPGSQPALFSAQYMHYPLGISPPGLAVFPSCSRRQVHRGILLNLMQTTRGHHNRTGHWLTKLVFEVANKCLVFFIFLIAGSTLRYKF